MRDKTKAPVSRDPQIVRARILDAAQAEFMAAGYAGASTNRMVERFGGSKPTMFRHFPTKRDLYKAVVTRIASRWQDGIAWRTITNDHPADWLVEFVTMALRWILSEENIFLGRMAIAEGSELSEAAELYRANASAPIEALLAGKFAAWTAQGNLTSTDPARDATSFLDLALSGPVSRRLYGTAPVMKEVALSAHAAYTVNLFLEGRAPRS